MLLPLLLAGVLGAGSATDPAAAKLQDRLTFTAAGRLRAESTLDQPTGEDRHRGRLRLRVGAGYDLGDGLSAHARLSTSSDGRDANNAYWDFGDGAGDQQGADVVLDRLFLEYRPSGAWELRAGKFGHVFQAPPVYGEFTWDADVQPAGVAAVWRPRSGDGGTAIDLRAAGYVVQENAAGDDPGFLGLQGNLGFQAGKATDLRLSTSVAGWSSTKAGTFPQVQGNTTSAGVIDQGFTVWDSHLAATHEGGVLERQTGFVQYVLNLDDDSGEDTGLALGLDLGPSRPGAWSCFLAWYDFDANAFFSPVAQDDTPIAGTGVGTGMRGFLGGVRYVVNERFAVRIWGLTSDADAADDPWRLRIDLDFTVK